MARKGGQHMIKNKSHKKMYSNLLLLLTALIWGFAFVAQSVSMDYIGPCTFTFSRFFIGGIVLLPVIALKNKFDKKTVNDTEIAGNQDKERENTDKQPQKENWKLLFTAGICCGIALGAGSLAQQYGIKYTTVGKAGFITALYIIIVPILGLFAKKRVGLKVWFSAVLAVVGLYLICM